MRNLRRIVLAAGFALLAATVLLRAAAKEDRSIPARSMKYTRRSADGAKAWQKDLRARLSRLLKIDDLIADRDAISFGPKEVFVADRGTYLVREVEINSTSSRRIRIVITVPTSAKGPFPAVVCIGGHGSSRYSPYDERTIAGDSAKRKSDHIYKGFGTVLAERGYVTVSATVSQHEIREGGRLLMGERLWDLIRCVDYLKSMPEVEGSRIGCAGLSLGGEMAMWLGAMDERVVATVSAGFLTTMDHMEQNHCMCWKFAGLRELVDYADIYSLIAARALQCQNGILEPTSQFYVPLARQVMEEVRMIYCDLGKPENVVLDVHEGGHEIDLPGLLYFFEKHLYGNRRAESKDI
jgi:dienelactone hydrolase